MNPFLSIVLLLAVVGWVIGSLAFIIIPALYIIVPGEDGKRPDGFTIAFNLFLVLCGIVGMLLFAALLTGAFDGHGHPDGCYRLITETYGKSTIQDYHVIPCP